MSTIKLFVRKTLKWLVILWLFATLWSIASHGMASIAEAAEPEAPLEAPPGPCDIPKGMHHTPSGWVKHIQTLVQNGSYKSPWVGQLRVAVAEEFVPHVRSAGLITTVTVAAYITACNKWLFIKYRQVGGQLRFVTHFYPESGLVYILRSVARDAIRYVWASGARAAMALRTYWTSIYMMVIPDCVDFTKPWYLAYAACGSPYGNQYVDNS